MKLNPFIFGKQSAAQQRFTVKKFKRNQWDYSFKNKDY